MQIILNALATVINLMFQIYFYIVIGRALISWVNPDPYNPIVRFLHNATEPVLYRIRNMIPIDLGGIDISPIIIVIALYFIDNFFTGLLLNYAASTPAGPTTPIYE